MDENILWLAIKKLPKIGDITFVKLLQKYKNIVEVYNSFPVTLDKKNALEFAKKEYFKLQQNNIKLLTYFDDFYPSTLKQIYSPPPFFYYYGDISFLKNNLVSIVGSRNPSDYGKNVCKDIIKELVEYNITTVSGFARGIDTVVHKETLHNKGKTIAVLGCGINIIYPASNKKLFFQIKEHGLILSEFFLDTKPEAGNFPKRNRIISGLSKGVVVIEASKKSGSLITANFALNQGKDVFAVPGSIYNYKSKGTHYLIKNGAYLIENAKDIIENLFPDRLILKNKKNTDKINFESPEAEKIYNILKENSLNIDELVILSKMDISKVSTILMELEIMGYIKKEAGKIYVAMV